MKDTYLEILKKYRTYLDCSRNKFEVFEKMDFSRLEQNNGNTWMVESILNKIVGYALIIQAFDPDEFYIIEKNINIFSGEELYKEASTVFSSCHDLVMDAIDNNCRNPIFTIFKDFINSSELYEEIMNNIHYYIGSIRDENTYYQMLELVESIDSSIMGSDQQQLFYIVNQIRNNLDLKELLNLLEEIAINRFKLRLLMGNTDIFTIDDIIVKKPNITYIDAENDLLAKLFILINSSNINFYFEKSSNITKLNDSYNLFKSYQYDYLKNKKIKDSMIQKCK